MLRTFLALSFLCLILCCFSLARAQQPELPENYAGPQSPPPVWGAVTGVDKGTDLLRFSVWEPRVEQFEAQREVEVNGKLEKRTFTYSRIVYRLQEHYWPLSATTAASKLQSFAGAESDLVGKTALFSNDGEADPQYLAPLEGGTPYISIPSPDFAVTPAEKLLREYLAGLPAPIGRIIANPHEKLAQYFPDQAFFAVQYPRYAADLLPAPLKPYNLAAVSADGKVMILNKPADLVNLAKQAAAAGKDKGAPRETAPAEELLSAASNPPEADASPSPADAQFAEKILQPEIEKLKLGKSFRPLRTPLLNIAFPGATFFPVTPPPAATPDNPADPVKRGFRERDVLVVNADGTTTLIQCEQGIASYMRKNFDKSGTDQEKRTTMRMFMALAQGKYPELTFGRLSAIKLSNEDARTTASSSAPVTAGGSGSLSVTLYFGPRGGLVGVRKPSIPTVNN